MELRFKDLEVDRNRAKPQAVLDLLWPLRPLLDLVVAELEDAEKLDLL